MRQQWGAFKENFRCRTTRLVKKKKKRWMTLSFSMSTAGEGLGTKKSMTPIRGGFGLSELSEWEGRALEMGMQVGLGTRWQHSNPGAFSTHSPPRP